jgi:hypothetical protein
VRIDRSLVDAASVFQLSLTGSNGQAWHIVPVTPPAFTSITRQANGTVALTATGLVHAPFSLWRGVDAGSPLAEWALVTNGVLTNAAALLADPSAGNYARGFYRLSIP